MDFLPRRARLTFGLKAVQQGWFAPRLPLAPGRESALLFVNKSSGCEGKMLVYNNANAQLERWNSPVRLIRIGMESRPDLARRYKVIRAPGLVLVNAEGPVIWRRDGRLSDESPFVQDTVKHQREYFRHAAVRRPADNFIPGMLKGYLL